MVKLLRLTAIGIGMALLAASAGAQTGAVPALLAQAVAATSAAKQDYAFDFELSTSERVWRARFVPDATPHLRLLSPNRDGLSNDDRRAFDRLAEQMEGVSWCASERMNAAANVRLVSETDEAATYAFQPTPDMIRSEQARPYAGRLRGEFTITKDNPDIARFRIYLPQAFSPMPLVNVERFNVTVSCATAPNGRRYAAETVSDVRGSALGSAFEEHSVQRMRNLSAAP
jgi:hypothetical protein